MDLEEFRKRGKEMVDVVCDYWKSLEEREPLSRVQPGYLEPLVPSEAPQEPEEWEEIMRDFHRVVMPGITHWQSPHFHAFFPMGISTPSLCGEILCSGLGVNGFNWVASPAVTELEMVVMKWLGKALGLPKEFYEGPPGGGVIQGTASESTVVALLSARSKKLEEIGDKDFPSQKMVLYFSDQCHSSVERAAMLLLMKSQKIKSDENGSCDVEDLKFQMTRDLEKGLQPTMCVATIGTTSTCAFDDLENISSVCDELKVWVHVDAAYAGSCLVCPELRGLSRGVEKCHSFNFNPHKWLLTNFDCSALWFRDSSLLVETFNVDALYLRSSYDSSIPDFRHWQIPLGRRFRSLKLWFVLRRFGIRGLQDHIRKHIELAKEFEELVRGDQRFQVINKVVLGLVCFRLKGENKKTKKLLEKLNMEGRVFLVPSEIKGIFFLRMCVCSPLTQQKHIRQTWNHIIKHISPD